MKKEEYTYLGGLVHGIGTLLTGMKTTMKVYFRKKVTEQYPENRKELKMFDRFRGTLTMPHNEQNEHRCIACGQEVEYYCFKCKFHNKQISAQPIGTLAYQHIIKLWNLHLKQ